MKSVVTEARANMEERTTAELIDTLGKDIDRCYRGLDGSIKRGKRNTDGTIEAKYEYHARQMIRAIASGSLLAFSSRSPSLASGAVAAGCGTAGVILSDASAEIGSSDDSSERASESVAGAELPATRRRNSSTRSARPARSATSINCAKTLSLSSGTLGGGVPLTALAGSRSPLEER